MTGESESEGVERKNVATSVITFEDKILILRRSHLVGTYQGKWACASGYIEGDEDALETAYREISEELGFGKNDVELLKRGEVILGRDGQILWAVHPFLFITRRTDIELDWEHSEFKWILPKEIDDYETVPNLKKTIESLLQNI